MSALAVIIIGPDLNRGLAALSLAACAAAQGTEVTLLFDRASVALLADPRLAEGLDTARALGVEVTACATGVADGGIMLPGGVASGGMMAFLAATADARLVPV